MYRNIPKSPELQRELYLLVLRDTHLKSLRPFLNGFKWLQEIVLNNNTRTLPNHINVRKGICSNIAEYMNKHFKRECGSNCYDSATELVSKMSLGWESHSGDLSYPVPHPNNKKDAFKTYLSSKNKWYGKYGTLRKDLLDHCIKELEELVNKFEPEKRKNK